MVVILSSFFKISLPVTTVLLALACGDGDGDGGGDGDGDGDGSGGTGIGDGDGDGDGEPMSTAPARTLSIVFDYRFDDTGFFDAPERRAALEYSAEVWTRRLTDDFPARPVGDVILAMDPEEPNGQEPLFIELDAEVDDMIIFVACSNDLASAGLNTVIPTSPFMVFDDMGNPVPNDYDIRLGGADYEPWVSSISFDCALPWFFDTSPEDLSDAEEGTYDFITTAAHEVGHALGLAGGVVPYDAYVDAARNYTGPGGTTDTGGLIPLTEDGHLVAEGYTMSVGSASRIPSEMEFGMLSDIGYDVVADY